jgi:chromatin modification-related protein VID21
MRDRRRKSIPTVVFGKPTKKAPDETSLAKREVEGPSMLDDYFTPLFIEGFARSSHSWMRNIEHLLSHAHKTISTDDAYIPLLEHQACRVLRKVYQWQQADKWSLRQPARAPEPTRPASQWDVVLQEMKWMRTDFREERKWKRAVAKNMAYACAEWVASTPEERKELQVNAAIPPLEAARDARVTDEATGPVESPLPELVHSDSPSNLEDEAIEEPEVLQTVAPSAIFALPDDEVVFSLRPSLVADQLLEELPLYGAPLKVPRFDIAGPEFDPDAHWKRPAVPLSKYVEGRMVFKPAGPPQKRSRYDYPDEEDEDGEVVFGQPPPSRVALPPVNANVALFDPSMQFVKEKLHAAHQFRPPVEYAMPLQSFYESRVASQWTQTEDDELRSLVRQYSYNWSLISSMVQMKSMYTSGAERRTPWECFERWITLEGLPQDMARTQYFRTYTNRMDTARKVILQQNQAATAQQQVGPNGAVTPVPRKRPTDTVKVERRRNHKHLGLIDAMRKLAKKRESTVQRNQHQAALAANRKVPEPPRTAGPSKTPRDYSLMRWERDQQLAEKMAQYAARQADIQQQRRVCLSVQTGSLFPLLFVA